MEALKKMNTLALAIPFAIAITFPVFETTALIFALLSTMVTGLIQFLIGIKMFADKPKDRNIQIYIFGAAAFFALWLINHLIGYNNLLSYILIAMPVLLAIYLSILINKNKQL